MSNAGWDVYGIEHITTSAFDDMCCADAVHLATVQSKFHLRPHQEANMTTGCLEARHVNRPYVAGANFCISYMVAAATTQLLTCIDSFGDAHIFPLAASGLCILVQQPGLPQLQRLSAAVAHPTLHPKFLNDGNSADLVVYCLLLVLQV